MVFLLDEPFHTSRRTEAEALAEAERGKRMAQEIKDRARQETEFGQRILEGANQTIYYPDGRVVEIKSKDTP